jgi:hypothetical protein
MANSENQVELKLNLDISGVQQALYNMIGEFNGTDKEFERISKKIQDSFKGLQAAIKRYGIDSEEARKANKRYQDSLTSLVANGIDPAIASFTKLDNAMTGAGTAASAAGGSIKKTNTNWSNIALVVQDLPYGFRAIQNNLPALVGSFAGATGAIYLGFSALIAITVVYEKEIAKLFSTVSSAEKKQKAYTDSLEGGKQAHAEAIKTVMLLNEQVKDAKGNKEKEKKAVDDYNSSIGVSIGKLNTFKEVQKSLIEQGDKYIEYIFLVSAADAAASKVAERMAEAAVIRAKKPEQFLTKLDKAMVALAYDGNKAKTTLQQIGERAKSIELKEVEDDITNLKNAFGSLKEAAKEYAKGIKFGHFDDGKEGERALKQQKKYAAQQKKLQIWIAKQAAKFGELEAAPKELTTKEQEDAYYKQIQENFKNKVAFDKEASNNVIANLKDQYKAELALTGNDYTAKIELQNAYLEKLKQGYMDGTIGLTEFNKARTDLIIEQNKTATDAAKQNMKDIVALGTSIMSALGPALDMLLEKGASLGEVLSRAFTDILKKIIKVAIAAAITVLLLSALGLADIGDIVKNFGALFKSGMGFGTLDFASLKATKDVADKAKPEEFASGGIISGPTYGLMGEYPGAKNNPEVVAPLDKLKDMLGGGGGSFVLRGQDLVLAMNRSESSLKLRRG